MLALLLNNFRQNLDTKGEFKVTTKKEMLDTFAENLEKERIKLGYTQCDFAQKLGISASSYRNIISRRVDTFSIMLAPKLYELTGRFLYEMFGQRSIEIEVLNKFRKLTDRQKAYINAKIEFELEMKAKEEDPANMLDVLLLTGNMEDGMVLDSAHEEHVYCPEYIEKYGERLHCGIRITSNHLHPVYIKGDIIGISKRPPRDGDTCVLVNKKNGRAYIRKFIQSEPCRMEPINGYGDIITIDPNNPDEMREWVKFGVVITVLRR